MPKQEDINCFGLQTQEFVLEYPMTQYTPPSSSDNENDGSETTVKTENIKRVKTEHNIKQEEDSDDESGFSESESVVENRRAEMRSFFNKACAVNFAKTCDKCGQVICDGTTLTSFIYERIETTGKTYEDVKKRFREAYTCTSTY